MTEAENKTQIRLHQFMVCEQFSTLKDDGYVAQGIRSNLYVDEFPYRFKNLYVVTCWRKDERFHKEVIEYHTDYGDVFRTPHMDIEPVTDNVLFRWHTHRFPSSLVIKKPTVLTVKVVLDWNTQFESYLLIEQRPA